MIHHNVGDELSKQLQVSLRSGPRSLKRIAINLWRSLISLLLIDCEEYPMTDDCIYAEVIERPNADTLFMGYCRGETKLFYKLEELIEFFVDNEVPGDSNVWSYLEPYAERGA